MSIKDMRTYMHNWNRGAEGANEQICLLKVQKQRLEAEAKHLAVRQQYVHLKIACWHAVEDNDAKRARRIAHEAGELARVINHES